MGRSVERNHRRFEEHPVDRRAVDLVHVPSVGDNPRSVPRRSRASSRPRDDPSRRGWPWAAMVLLLVDARDPSYGTTTVCDGVAALAPQALFDVTAVVYVPAGTVPDSARSGVKKLPVSAPVTISV